MIALFFIGFALILEPLLEKVFQHFFLFQPVFGKIDAGKSYHAYTAKERISRFQSVRQIILLSTGILLLTIITAIEIFNNQNFVLKGFFLISLAFILQPASELIYYRWSVNRYWKEDMTAKEMSAYHDFCNKYHRFPLSLNGSARQKLRFLMLTIGICGLSFLSLFVFNI